MQCVIRSLLVSFFFCFFSVASFASQLVNINDASAVVIAENLSGIGEAKARAIVAYRKDNGRFTRVDDLVNVKGIGLKILEKNRGLISLGKAVKSPVVAAPKKSL